MGRPSTVRLELASDSTAVVMDAAAALAIAAGSVIVVAAVTVVVTAAIKRRSLRTCWYEKLGRRDTFQLCLNDDQWAYAGQE
jgi:hypothetical protein